MTGQTSARPFLKWAGGKTQLLAQLAPLIPPRFSGYHEPFVGSAAVFFYLQAAGSFHSTSRPRLTDSNAELINGYQAVRDEVEPVIDLLARHKLRHSKEYYYAVRAQVPAELSHVERAARLIYLNKTCFNGLYRVNSKGQFNVPLGRYKNPGIFSAEELRAASWALTDATIEVGDFQSVTKHARSGDFVYFDPPYHPLTATANFTSYTANEFGEKEQRELAEVFRALDAKGCRLMLSNSWTPFILGLYTGFNLVEVKATRQINSDAGKRGKVSEVVVMNYEIAR